MSLLSRDGLPPPAAAFRSTIVHNGSKIQQRPKGRLKDFTIVLVAPFPVYFLALRIVVRCALAIATNQELAIVAGRQPAGAAHLPIGTKR